jgi:hypothetical protein
VSLYDPSYALTSAADSFIPVAMDPERRETLDAAIAEPIKDVYTAPFHRRFQVRAELQAVMDRALRSLVTSFHRLRIAGSTNVKTVVEPTEAEKREALARLRSEPELYRLAHTVATARSFMLYLDTLDARDGISSKPRVADGRETPGIAGTNNGRSTMSFMPDGLR